MTYIGPSVNQPTVHALTQAFEAGELTGPEFHDAIKEARRNPQYRFKPTRIGRIKGNVYGVRAVLAHRDTWMTARQILKEVDSGTRNGVAQALRSLYFDEQVERRGNGTNASPFEYRLVDG